MSNIVIAHVFRSLKKILKFLKISLFKKIKEQFSLQDGCRYIYVYNVEGMWLGYDYKLCFFHAKNARKSRIKPLVHNSEEMNKSFFCLSTLHKPSCRVDATY